jgi:hypothetical protein
MGDCYAMVKILNGKFKHVYGKPGKPFLCWPKDLQTMPKNPEVAG